MLYILSRMQPLSTDSSDLQVIVVFIVLINAFLYFCSLLLHLPAPGSQNSLDSTNWLPGVAHQKGDITKLWHRGQKLHVFSKARLVLKRGKVGLVAQSFGHHVKCFAQHYTTGLGQLLFLSLFSASMRETY